MNPEAQRVTIAEACGKYRRGRFEPDDYLPDYLSDLNAMHEAEKALPESHRIQYGTELINVCDQALPSAANTFHLFHATAAQRAEAFLRTLNLWKD